jgi:hypothetical protein
MVLGFYLLGADTYLGPFADPRLLRPERQQLGSDVDDRDVVPVSVARVGDELAA